MIINLFEDENPIVSTERLTLRLMKMEDAEDILDIRGDSDTASDAGVPCMESIEDARDYIEKWCEDSMVIVHEDKVIGLIERYVDEQLLYDSTFLGYYIKKSHRNKGYMTEALKALRRRWKDTSDEIPMLWMFPGNDASKRVAEKSGWTYRDSHVVDINCLNQYVDFYE